MVTEMAESNTIHSFIHFWQAPLRVHSAERRHQSPEWTVLSQVNCIVHIEVAEFQILLNGFHPCNTGNSKQTTTRTRIRYQSSCTHVNIHLPNY